MSPKLGYLHWNWGNTGLVKKGSCIFTMRLRGMRQKVVNRAGSVLYFITEVCLLDSQRTVLCVCVSRAFIIHGGEKLPFGSVLSSTLKASHRMTSNVYNVKRMKSI